MIFEMTYQVRVSDIKEGEQWYRIFLNKSPDFIYKLRPLWHYCCTMVWYTTALNTKNLWIKSQRTIKQEQ
ncbi:hypothetical protein AC622_02100 [Bacillus sp. FJAT-27916]|nr:hypothetical protein AC622_02100 [Bacillus sp. FJAT-27916]